MKLQFKTWGNSLAVRVPVQLTRELGIEDGSEVEVQQEGERLILTPIKKKPSYTLEELLFGITSENKHEEFPTGPAAGKEEC